MTWWSEHIAAPSESAREAALARQQSLTKPPGSLGKLETLAAAFAAWQSSPLPVLEQVAITVFAADHGVAAEQISAFPQTVTHSMLSNFAAGGAAICVLADQHAAQFSVVNVGVVGAAIGHPTIINQVLAAGSQNMCLEPAMSDAILQQALSLGAKQISSELHLFIGGEMGIGNTTAAAAMTSAYLGLPASATVGSGTGIRIDKLAHKVDVVNRAMSRHRQHLDSPVEVLRRLGGLEIAALAGAFIGSAMHGVPALVDGYVASAAAIAATRLNPAVRPWLLFSHRSSEPGHTHLLRALEASPLIDFELRLGEGSGAALVLPLLRSACLLHGQMATFADLGITD